VPHACSGAGVGVGLPRGREYCPRVRLGVRPENPIEALALLSGRVPSGLFETYFAFMAARVVMAATSLGVFEALAQRPDDATGLARRLNLDPAGAEVLLLALRAQDYVEECDGRLHNSAQTERFLLRAAPESLTEWIGGFNYDMWEHFGHLEEVVRSGTPIGLHEREVDDPYWERYLRGLFEISRLQAEVVARLIPTERPRRMLDLAGGHGGFAMALCRRHVDLSATVVELEGAARIGRRIVAEQGMAERVAFAEGDLFEHDVGTGHDIATAHNIAHHFGPERNVELLRRARAALRPGGTMAVLELERPEAGRRGSPIGTLTGVLFFITSAARTYTGRELAAFFAEAGFRRVRARRHPELPGSVVLLGRA